MRASNLKNVPAWKFFALLVACMLVPVALVSLWPVPPGVYLQWDWANAIGYIALSLLLVLFVYRGRARAFPAYSGRFFANLHRDLGYITLIMVAVHIAMLLHAESLLLEHLQPTAPLHMSSGLLASLLILILVASSIPRLRRKLWRDYHLFRHIHAMFAVTALLLAVVHVVYSGFYLNSPWKLGFALLVALVVPGIYGCSHKQPAGSTSRARDSVRHSHLIAYGSAITAALIGLLLAFVSSVA